MTISEQIRACAFSLLKDNPDGIRYSRLIAAISQANGAFKHNTIHGTVWDLEAKFPEKVYKPARGLFRLVEFREKSASLPNPKTKTPTGEDEPFREEDFYRSFADWLVNEMEECTKAIPLGGNKFRDKWGTPDVLGKRESRRSDIIQAPLELVAAEIKLATSQTVEAFGQACAYCLFAHKSYLVIPRDSPQDEIDRVDALCQIFGIGLVLFNGRDVNDPAFEIRVRPKKQDPDMFYVNKYLKQVEQELFGS